MKVKMILPALTEAKSPFFRPVKYSLFPPLGLATLAGYLNDDIEVTLHDEHVERVNIDDEPDLVWAVSHSLRDAGYTVTSASDGVEALAAAHEWQPDLMILDVVMPGPDGFVVCRRIRRDTGLGAIPILFLSALATCEALREHPAVGAAGHDAGVAGGGSRHRHGRRRRRGRARGGRRPRRVSP